ncbi:hypothetical protein [Acidovorax sp.]|uniref:hypothetical protein n=1 Tax=Acidovorax sp. TaxID=1872122 RepID=UPI002ACED3D0|nr:hypothetical protein [Acidovorax sp.]MDZ7864355.1 hypothetical protein [Acidovorax sp.]
MPIKTFCLHTRSGLAALSIGALALLAGCGSNGFDEHRIDQPLPFASVWETDPRMPPCRNLPGNVKPAPRDPPKGNPQFEVPLLHGLEEGSSCWFVVQSGVHPEETGNGTGLMLVPNGAYRIFVPEAASRTLYDKGRKTPAPQGDTGSLIARLMGSMKITKKENWFALMATASESRHTKHVLSGSRLACMAGELSLHVNDAYHFYGNNFGNLLVVIKRESGSTEMLCSATGVP